MTKILSEPNLFDKLKRIKALQDKIIEDADKQNAYITKQYFGIERRVVDETKFKDEIDELKTLLKPIQFSTALHDRFDNSRERLVDAIQKNNSTLSNQIDVFEKLNVQQRLNLAKAIADTFSETFFDFGYNYVLPIMEYDPDAFTSLHRSFQLKKDSVYPVSSRIRFSKAVLGKNAKRNCFLNLVFHEACVHAPMYQLQQGFQYGYLSSESNLYQDAKKVMMAGSISLTPKFFIASIYPNFLEEAVAFKQSAMFVGALGLETLGTEDDIILKSTNRNWPYTSAKI